MIRITTETQDAAICNLIAKGMSYRNVSKLFDISRSTVDKIVKRNKVEIVDKLKGRVCVLCGTDKNFIDKNFYTICKKCEVTVKNITKHK